jgi:hypothetical protein
VRAMGRSIRVWESLRYCPFLECYKRLKPMETKDIGSTPVTMTDAQQVLDVGVGISLRATLDTEKPQTERKLPMNIRTELKLTMQLAINCVLVMLMIACSGVSSGPVTPLA